MSTAESRRSKRAIEIGSRGGKEQDLEVQRDSRLVPLHIRWKDQLLLWYHFT